MMKLIELRAKERGYPTNDDLIRRLALPLEIRIETLRNYLAINDEAFSTECFRLGIKLLENNEALVIQNQVTSQDVIKAIEELEKKLVKIEQERPQLAVESKD